MPSCVFRYCTNYTMKVKDEGIVTFHRMEPGVRIVGLLLLFLNYATLPIFWLVAFFRPHKRLPPIQDPLLSTSASQLAQLIRNKKVTSQHIVETFIQRIKDINPILNAIVEERFEDAIREAKEVDQYMVKCSEEQLVQIEKTKPFLGVPITIKESCSLKGMSIVGGSLKRMGMKASEDGIAVSRLKASGLIPLLVSTTPEMCLSWQTNNLVTGVTNNPYDTTRTPGGSSGGEGALIAGGGSVIGISSDIAGSIRIPAMFCGIYGHKPTAGLVPLHGHFPGSSDDELFQYCLTIGPLTRYSQDLEPMLQVMAGDKFAQLNPDEEIDLHKLKILYSYQASEDISLLPTQKSIKKAIERAVKHMKSKFNSDVSMINHNLEESVEMATSIFFDIGDVAKLLHDEETGEDRNLLLEIFKAFLGIGHYSLPSLGFYLIRKNNGFVRRSKNVEYQKKAARLKDEIISSLGTNGVFVYPTFPESAYYHNQIFTKTSGVLYTMLFNVFGMPATHVPMGLDEKGLPIGFQVIAAPNRDRLCLAVARELEKAFGGWVPPR